MARDVAENTLYYYDCIHHVIIFTRLSQRALFLLQTTTIAAVEDWVQG